ncbi:hypothetical protein ACS0TY_002417 [Phlomoides rotata]
MMMVPYCLSFFFLLISVLFPLIYNTLLGIENDVALIFHLKDLGLEFTWPVGKIKEVLPDPGSHVASYPLLCSFEATKAIASLVEEQNFPEAKIELAAAKAVVTSELSLGPGLGWQVLEDNELELLNKWAFEGEKMIHGKPSWIDNTVSTYGNMINFRSDELTHIRTNMPLKMLKTNTKFGRNTKSLVPDDLAITEKEEKLEKLLEMSQGFLQCMGVSQDSIENVIRTTLKYKLSTKLTGAGGGGCVLTLLPTRLGTLKDQWENTLPSWGKSDDPCTAWEGDACNNSRVPSLGLSIMGLTGKMSRNIGGLTGLVSLFGLIFEAIGGRDLSFNPGLSGSLSPRLGDLRKLTILYDLMETINL